MPKLSTVGLSPSDPARPFSGSQHIFSSPPNRLILPPNLSGPMTCCRIRANPPVLLSPPHAAVQGAVPKLLIVGLSPPDPAGPFLGSVHTFSSPPNRLILLPDPSEPMTCCWIQANPPVLLSPPHVAVQGAVPKLPTVGLSPPDPAWPFSGSEHNFK